MKKCLLACFVFAALMPCQSENYLLNGGQRSIIAYEMTQEVVPADGIKLLILSYVIPQSFESPSYNQQIENFKLDFSIPPSSKERQLDKRGNVVIKAVFRRPTRPIKATLSMEASNYTDLKPLNPKAKFPLRRLPRNVHIYLKSTKAVPAGNTQIVKKARQLTAKSKTQFDAVQKILSWIVDNMTYVLRPKNYSAMYSFQTGRGNCQNYSHLAAALMRAVGIPVRVVNGVTLREPYNVKLGEYLMTMRMAQGRHSWIEVYFPDLGWVPFDPQQMQLFVSNRFIRVEVGLDNDETVADGSILFSRYPGSRGMPRFRESIAAEFHSDEVELLAERQSYGPRKMLFTPPVQANFNMVRSVQYEEAGPEYPAYSQSALQNLHYVQPTEFGNLDYPQNIDFLEASGPVEAVEDSMMMMRKSFLVETSEYVTSSGQKFAQTFHVDNPIQLKNVDLALHRFGGSGQLWIELIRDDGEGRPGQYISSSELLSVADIPQKTGYDWVPFSFTGSDINLGPGRYWIALGYTGSPIINWFFTYGKPVGPADGTRYNTLFDETWSRSLVYEFNYRIRGLKAGD